MSGTLLGEIDWSVQCDEDGHRDYSIDWLIQASDIADGPATIAATTGLPAIGDTWTFGNDNDIWAWCRPNWKVTPVLTHEPNTLWIVTTPFSTRPIKRCQSAAIENPLSEPPKLSGSFVNYTYEARLDKDNARITNSAAQTIKGPVVERDGARPNVSISMNLSTLPLTTYAQYMHSVNDSTLWGLAARCVKLSSVSWERVLYGVCTFYYVVNYEFDINYDTFDRVVLDEGTRYLAPGGTSGNQRHYVAFRDAEGNPETVILNGSGEPWDGTGSPGTRTIRFYPSRNLLTLGIPSSL